MHVTSVADVRYLFQNTRDISTVSAERLDAGQTVQFSRSGRRKEGRSFDMMTMGDVSGRAVANALQGSGSD